MHNKNPINYRDNQVSGLEPTDNLKSYQTVQQHVSLLGLKYIRAILNTIKYISNQITMEGNYSNPATSTL